MRSTSAMDNSRLSMRVPIIGDTVAQAIDPMPYQPSGVITRPPHDAIEVGLLFGAGAGGGTDIGTAVGTGAGTGAGVGTGTGVGTRYRYQVPVVVLALVLRDSPGLTPAAAYQWSRQAPRSRPLPSVS